MKPFPKLGFSYLWHQVTSLVAWHTFVLYDYFDPVQYDKHAKQSSPRFKTYPQSLSIENKNQKEGSQTKRFEYKFIWHILIFPIVLIYGQRLLYYQPDGPLFDLALFQNNRHTMLNQIFPPSMRQIGKSAILIAIFFCELNFCLFCIRPLRYTSAYFYFSSVQKMHVYIHGCHGKVVQILNV